MNAEQKLVALWAGGTPSAPDPDFTLAVMARIERRRVWSDLVNLGLIVVVVGVLGWALAPAIEGLFAAGADDVGRLATTGLVTATSLICGIWLAMGGSRASLA